MSVEPRKTAKKRGPRPQGPYADKRKTLTTRITGEMRTRLEIAAENSGRSLSQEIESRLEQSFVMQGALGLLGADANTATLFADFLHAKSLIEPHTGKSVWTDYEAHRTFSIAVQQLLLERAPKPGADMKKRTDAWEKERKKGVYKGPRGVVGMTFVGDMSDTSPIEQAEMLGRAAARVVYANRNTALAEALLQEPTPSDIDVGDDD